MPSIAPQGIEPWYEGLEPSVLPLRRRGMVRPEGLEPSLLQIKSLMCYHYTMDALLNVGMLPLLSGVLPSFNHLSLNFLYILYHNFLEKSRFFK